MAAVLIETLFGRITRLQGVELKLNTRVEKIGMEGNLFRLHASSRHESKTETVLARKVIVACGRKGYLWWRAELRRLGISFRQPVVSAGLRFECPSGILRGASSQHPDFKTTQYHNSHKIKTFCFCAGKSGGRIKFVDHGPYTLLDGHTSVMVPSKVENFALLAQLNNPSGRPLSFDEINSGILARYRQLRPNRPGKPVIQWYQDFRSGTITLNSVQDIIEKTKLEISMTDYGVGKLSNLFGEHVRNAFCEVFERLLHALHPHSSVEEITERVVVAGLVLEGIWDEVVIDRDMKSSLPSLYVVGDCAGRAQGIMQAAVSGMLAAKACAAELRTSTTNSQADIQRMRGSSGKEFDVMRRILDIGNRR